MVLTPIVLAVMGVLVGADDEPVTDHWWSALPFTVSS